MKQAEEFELRYEELNRQLQDPAVLGTPTEYSSREGTP